MDQKLVITRYTPCRGAHKHTALLIVGESASGKTLLVKRLLKDIKVDRKIVFGLRHEYDDIVDPQFVHENVNEELLRRILRFQTERVKLEKERQTCYYDEVNHPLRMVMVFDRFLDRGFTQSSTFQSLVVNSRHFLITVILTAQHATYFSPRVRMNMDAVLITGGCTVHSQLRRLYEEYFSVFNSFEKFRKVYESITGSKKYRVLVEDNTVRDQMGSVKYYDSTSDRSIHWKRIAWKLLMMETLNRKNEFPLEINRMVVTMC